MIYNSFYRQLIRDYPDSWIAAGYNLNMARHRLYKSIRLENNKIPLFIDPFGGSGGLSLNYVNHFIKHNELGDKFWAKNINNIYT